MLAGFLADTGRINPDPIKSDTASRRERRAPLMMSSPTGFAWSMPHNLRKSLSAFSCVGPQNIAVDALHLGKTDQNLRRAPSRPPKKARCRINHASIRLSRSTSWSRTISAALSRSVPRASPPVTSLS